MAAPAGLAAAPPAVGTRSAVAAPTGCVGCCDFGCGASGGFVLCELMLCGVAEDSLCAAPVASGYVVTGCRGPCEGSMVAGLGLFPFGEGFVGCVCAGAVVAGGSFVAGGTDCGACP